LGQKFFSPKQSGLLSAAGYLSARADGESVPPCGADERFVQLGDKQRKSRGTVNADHERGREVLAAWRRAYSCDCDGISHTLGDFELGAPQAAVRRHLDVIKRVTGNKPPTCPWRAYHDPLVFEVMELAWAFDPPNLAAALPPDPPAILVDAIRTYRMALLSTQADDMRSRREKAERERASRKG
jgi:hypothetical protein